MKQRVSNHTQPKERQTARRVIQWSSAIMSDVIFSLLAIFFSGSIQASALFRARSSQHQLDWSCWCITWFTYRDQKPDPIRTDGLWEETTITLQYRQKHHTHHIISPWPLSYLSSTPDSSWRAERHREEGGWGELRGTFSRDSKPLPLMYLLDCITL